MKQFKGTPGPWSVVEIDNDDLSEISGTMISGENIVIAHIGPSIQTSLGDDVNNAHLIAAAPELLELVMHVKNCVENDGSYEPANLDYFNSIIAKALGETE